MSSPDSGLLSAPVCDHRHALFFPMHGHRKMVNEGLRTRDGHLIEAMSKICRSDFTVISRPEPVCLKLISRRTEPHATKELRRRESIVDELRFIDPQSWRLPRPWNPKHWWIASRAAYPRRIVPAEYAIFWTPFALAAVSPDVQVKVLDLLDDWTVHHDFQKIANEVNRAYALAFAKADLVFANSEATYELAVRFDRPDALVLPNGCQPEGIPRHSSATGPVTIGYGGKLGRRLDKELIARAVNSLPHCLFLFMGQDLSGGSFARFLRSLGPRCIYKGDLPYQQYRKELATFDVAWVPHSVGADEVGGDAIKIYEYRAAGIPTFTTPIIGADRISSGVFVEGPARLVDVMSDYIHAARTVAGRIPRLPWEVPTEMTWLGKAKVIHDSIMRLNRH